MESNRARCRWLPLPETARGAKGRRPASTRRIPPSPARCPLRSAPRTTEALPEHPSHPYRATTECRAAPPRWSPPLCAVAADDAPPRLPEGRPCSAVRVERRIDLRGINSADQGPSLVNSEAQIRHEIWTGSIDPCGKDGHDADWHGTAHGGKRPTSSMSGFSIV